MKSTTRARGKHFLAATLLALSATLLVIPAGAAQTAYVLDQSASRVTFKGRAFLRTITGWSGDLEGTLSIRGSDLASLRGDVRFPVTSLETDPSMRPRELAETFGADRSPEIVFRLDSLSRRNQVGECLVFGHLTMNGVTRPVSFVGRTRSAGDRVVTEGTARVDLRHWRIHPPRRFGLRMAPDITLGFRAEFRRRVGQHTALFRLDEEDSR
jgi:polyisoprenoid-binding protein YceI